MGAVALRVVTGRERVYILEGSVPIFSTHNLIIFYKIQVNNDMIENEVKTSFWMVKWIKFQMGWIYISKYDGIFCNYFLKMKSKIFFFFMG